MGCDYYSVDTWNEGKEMWEKKEAYFGDSDFGCLCTFPCNYREGFSAPEVRKLAYLGAIVVLAHHGELLTDTEYYNIPESIPDWVKRDIDWITR